MISISWSTPSKKENENDNNSAERNFNYPRAGVSPHHVEHGLLLSEGAIFEMR
jgi:hypothetical protein